MRMNLKACVNPFSIAVPAPVMAVHGGRESEVNLNLTGAVVAQYAKSYSKNTVLGVDSQCGLNTWFLK